jgi:hypothetical protein
MTARRVANGRSGGSLKRQSEPVRSYTCDDIEVPRVADLALHLHLRTKNPRGAKP